MKRPGMTVNGQLWERCWMCGDSRNQGKAHLNINILNGLYHCYRCGGSGRLSINQLLARGLGVELDSEEGDEAEEQAPPTPASLKPRLVPGPGSTRFSALKRQHVLEDTQLVDVFESRTLAGQVIGYQLRADWGSGKVIVGQRGFAYVGEAGMLQSTIRLVEGPYDVLYKQDVATFGMPTRRQVQKLIGHTLILCPDGDVWPRSDMLLNYLNQFHGLEAAVECAEKLPDGKDPDQVPAEERERLEPKALWTLREELRRKKGLADPYLQPYSPWYHQRR